MPLEPIRIKNVHSRSPAATLGVFAAGIAHEIRTPIGAILGSVQALESSNARDMGSSSNGDADSKIAAARAEALKSIAVAARRLNDFVGSLEGLQTEDLDAEQNGLLADALHAAIVSANAESERAVIEGDIPDCYCRFPIVRHMMQMLVERLALGVAEDSQLFLKASCTDDWSSIQIRSDDPKWTQKNLDALLDITLNHEGTHARFEVGIMAAQLLIQHIGGTIETENGGEPRLELRFPVTSRPEAETVVEPAVAVD